MSASENLKKWFDGLSSSDQKEVLQFLYGGNALLEKGMYVGPRPGLVHRGLLLDRSLLRLLQFALRAAGPLISARRSLPKPNPSGSSGGVLEGLMPPKISAH